MVLEKAIFATILLITLTTAQYSTVPYSTQQQQQYSSNSMHSNNQQHLCYAGTNDAVQTAVCPYNYCFKSVVRRGDFKKIFFAQNRFTKVVD